MPILTTQRRMIEVGRLRLGVRGNKGQPEKLSTWRATSPSRNLIETLASIHGGKVNPWKPSASSMSQWEVITDSTELDVVVAPGQVLSAWYEMWTGSGCARRCDGIRETIQDEPCLCPVDATERKALAAKGRACRPTTRLSVILKDCPAIGLWRVESHGESAECELAGAAELLDYASQNGIFLPAILRADSRSSGRNKYVVPMLIIAASFPEVAAALNLPQVGALTTGMQAPRALESGSEPSQGYVQPNGRVHVPEEVPKAPMIAVNRPGFPVPKPVALTAPAPAVEPEPPLPGDEGVDLAFAEIEDADIVEEEECFPSAPVTTAPKATTAPVPVTTASQNAPGLKPTIPLSTVSFSTSSFVPAAFVEAQLGVAPSLGGPPISGGKGKETTPTPPKKNIGMGPKAKETMAKRAAPMKAVLSSKSNTPTATPPSESSTPRETSAPSAAADAIRKGIVIAAKDSDIDDTLRHEACLYISEGRSEHAVDMTEKEAQALYALFSGIRRKKITVEYSPDGVVSFL